MSEKSTIAWTDSTHNFWRGCAKVSAGCAHCYAETMDTRFGGGHWGKGAPHVRSKDFDAPLRWNRKPWVCDDCGNLITHIVGDFQGERILCSCGGRIHRRRVFSLSLGDWLDPEVPVEWLADMLDVIRRCDKLYWILCTKRPELWEQRIRAAQNHICKNIKSSDDTCTAFWIQVWLAAKNQDGPLVAKPPHNIILLTSIEDQKSMDERGPDLLRIPAARRGLSIEPLLGPVDLISVCADESMGVTYNALTGKNWSESPLPTLDWVIVGGESGPKARPCNVEWIRSIKNQCKAASVPIFVKQVGSNAIQTVCEDGSPNETEPYVTNHPKGGEPSEWSEDLRVQEFYR